MIPDAILASSHLSAPDLHNSPGSSVFDLPINSASPQHPQPTSPSRTPAPSGSENQPLYAPEPDGPSFVIISGGTGCNAICAAFTRACYVLPVSDDGGSSSEIIRVLGGPSIGDIRSRLVRLIPPARPARHSTACALCSPIGCPLLCRSSLRGTSGARSLRGGVRCGLGSRMTARRLSEVAFVSVLSFQDTEGATGFLVYFESEVLRRAHKSFSFVNGSIGNYFLAAAQGFFRSLPSAIFLFSSITGSQANILPVIVTNHTVTISAELTSLQANGTKLVGQCEISHPVSKSTLDFDDSMDNLAYSDGEEPPDSPDCDVGATISHAKNIMFLAEEKDEYEALESPITRLYYINAYGHEINPSPNPDYLSSLNTNEMLVYSCGSLWTSIIPCLALRGVASSIARSQTLKAKILFLNSKNDRETTGYTAEDYINAITLTLNAHYNNVKSYGIGGAETTYPISAFITHLVYLRGAAVPVDEQRVTKLGVRCIPVDSELRDKEGVPMYDAASLCIRTIALTYVFARAFLSTLGPSWILDMDFYREIFGFDGCRTSPSISKSSSG
ncbi:hypothetical protein EVG20_g8590 [Dentipellis fragilis]|uniref:Uncharacterized protein n=1 Tax=Dentipellis fragilis TaxID=205917 RepID=A0A4Y9Y7B2_9AGAM|nr:hypothetical protein EVG20_g8590 [Dentipellis fragilis]